MSIFKHRPKATTINKPIDNYLDVGEPDEDLDQEIHATNWLVDLGSEPEESGIKAA